MARAHKKPGAVEEGIRGAIILSPWLEECRDYQPKWANALLASAMRWTFSRLL